MSAGEKLSAEEKLLLSRMVLSTEAPFFSYLLTFLKSQKANNLPMPTMATDGKKIFYVESFVDSLNLQELNFGLCHEILHVVLNHVARRKEREPKKWNAAVDYAVHCILMKQLQNVIKAPNIGILYDTKYDGMTAEEIYEILPDKPGKGSGSGDGDGGWGGFDHHMDGEGEEMTEEEQAQWRSRGYMAYEHAKEHGKCPAGMERFFDNLTKPKVNWRQVLQNFVNQFNRDDYTWARPNRNHLHRGFYLPSSYQETIGTIVVAVDTSGSVSQEQLTAFLSEMQGIRNSYDMKMIMITCDAAVHDVYEIEKFGNFDPNLIKVGGGGGTSFVPPFTYLEENNIEPTCMIYETDAYGDFPEQPNYPVLWLLTENHGNPPWGTQVVIDV